MDIKVSKMWIAFRVLVIAVNIWGIGSYPREKSNLDWPACLIISVLVTASVFGWLVLIRSRPEINKSGLNYWGQPFFPMRNYPLQFLSVTSSAVMAGGGVAMLEDFIFKNGHEAFGGTFFFMGVSIWVARKVWMKVFGDEIPGNEKVPKKIFGLPLVGLVFFGFAVLTVLVAYFLSAK